MDDKSDVSSNINSALFLMASASPRVRESIERELYRVDAPSDLADNQYILEHCFVELVKDLEEVGLVLDMDFTRFVSNHDELFKFINLSQLLLPNHLYPLMSLDNSVRKVIESIVNGDLGEDETAIEVWLSQIAGLDTSIALYPNLSEFISSIFSNISQTQVFSDYLRHQVELLSDENLMLSAGEDDHPRYNLKIKDIISRVFEASELIPESDKIEFCKTLFIQDLSAPVNFHDYSYLLLENKDTIPEDLVSSFERKWYHYWISHRWNALYYPLRKMPTPTDLVPIFLIIPYGLIDTEKQYMNLVSTFPEDARDYDIEASILALYRR